MKPLDEMTVDDILDESVFTELLDMQAVSLRESGQRNEAEENAREPDLYIG